MRGSWSANNAKRRSNAQVETQLTLTLSILPQSLFLRRLHVMKNRSRSALTAFSHHSCQNLTNIFRFFFKRFIFITCWYTRVTTINKTSNLNLKSHRPSKIEVLVLINCRGGSIRSHRVIQMHAPKHFLHVSDCSKFNRHKTGCHYRWIRVFSALSE